MPGLTAWVRTVADRQRRELARRSDADLLARAGAAGFGEPRYTAVEWVTIRPALTCTISTAAMPGPAIGRSKGSTGGRPPQFDPEIYKQRNTAERAINKLKAFRAFALRTDKRAFVFQGTTDVASIKIWLRDPVKQDPSDTP